MWFLYIILRKSGALKNSSKEIFIKINNKLIIGENLYKISKHDKIRTLRKIDDKYIIKIVSREDSYLLKEYSDRYRSKDHFEKNIKTRLKDQDKYTGIAVIDKVKNKLAYLCWISFNGEIDTGIHYKFELKNNEAHLFDADTVPEYRRQGLHNRMMQERINWCVNKGIKKIYISIYRNNYRAINNINKFDFKICKRIFLIKPIKRIISF